MKVRTINQGRIKPKYNPVPTAREKAYHVWLMETFPCICGCDGQATHVHHPLTRHPAQRWRRDHEYVVPMTDPCHRTLHDAGDEQVWRPDLQLDGLAYWHRANAFELGILTDD